MDRILIIEDNETMRLGMLQTLERAGFTATGVASGKDGLALVDSEIFSCVISDLKMAEMDGIEVIRRINELQPQLPVMLITAFGTIEKAVEAMQLGACDFITKPFPPELLRVKVKRAVELANLSRQNRRLFFENQYLKAQESTDYRDGEIVGKSKVMQTVHEQIRKVSPTDATVFIHGESGTGKELIARAIHKGSPRQNSSFIKVNCSALATGVLESELFGHEKGAFTGAIKRKPGRFELADGGTLFLDEIGDIDASIQLKLLRVLQEREFERVGGTQTLKVDVRIISATNQDLKSKVDLGHFREDLYYRLVIFPLNLPPLRDRPEDIPAIAKALLTRMQQKHHNGLKTLDKKALTVLQKYSWPGNVRELENLLEQAYILSDSNMLDSQSLPGFLKEKPSDGTIVSGILGQVSLPEILDQTEKQLLVQALEECRGVKSHVAKLLGIKTSALYYKLEKFGLMDKT